MMYGIIIQNYSGLENKKEGVLSPSFFLLKNHNNDIIYLYINL